MKVAVISESPADEVAIRVLVESVLKEQVHLEHPSLRARGWPNVAQILPAVIRHLHFNTKADGLVVVVDSDDTVVHTEAHEAPGYYHPQCRLCYLRAIFRKTAKRFPAAHGRDRVMRCVGVAVPAIEAWYLSGHEPAVTEDIWIAGQERGVPPYTRKELKYRVYGTERPSLPHEVDCALREVHRLRKDTRRLEADFPGGFGSLVRDLRAWKTAMAERKI